MSSPFVKAILARTYAPIVPQLKSTSLPTTPSRSFRRVLTVVTSMFAAAVMTACTGGPLGVTFDVDLDSSVVIEGSPLGALTGGLGFGGFTDLDFEQEQAFENNDTRKDLVQSAMLKEVTLTIASPNDGNFDWLNSIEFYVEAPDLDRVLVASATIPDGEEIVSLDLENVDLAPYIKAETVTFSSEANGSQPAEDHTVDAVMVVEVTAGPAS